MGSLPIDILQQGCLQTVSIKVAVGFARLGFLSEVVHPAHLALQCRNFEDLFAEKLVFVKGDAVVCLLEFSGEELKGKFEERLGGPGSFAEDFEGEADGQLVLLRDGCELGLHVVADPVLGDDGLKAFGVLGSAAG